MFLLSTGLQVRFPRSRCQDGDWGFSCLLGIIFSEKKWREQDCKERHNIASANWRDALEWVLPLGAVHVGLKWSGLVCFFLVPLLHAGCCRMGVTLGEEALSSWDGPWGCWQLECGQLCPDHNPHSWSAHPSLKVSLSSMPTGLPHPIGTVSSHHCAPSNLLF